MSTKPTDKDGLKCAIDHMIEAQQKGEINEDNVLYIVENINVAGKFPSLDFFSFNHHLSSITNVNWDFFLMNSCYKLCRAIK